MLNCIIVGVGGFIGSVCRYLFSLLPISHQSGFPVKTLCINVAGAFAIGLIAALAERDGALDPRLVLMLKVGVCGGFTTFSTFALESFDMLQSGSIVSAGAYMLLSAALCVAAVLAAKLLIP